MGTDLSGGMGGMQEQGLFDSCFYAKAQSKSRIKAGKA
jgi:hypothetical protein